MKKNKGPYDDPEEIWFFRIIITIIGMTLPTIACFLLGKMLLGILVFGIPFGALIIFALIMTWRHVGDIGP